MKKKIFFFGGMEEFFWRGFFWRVCNFKCGFFCVFCRWASQQCDKDGIPKIPENLRMVLKKAITLIRFPLMSVKDFSLHVAPTELLSDKEMVGVLVYYSLPPSER